MNQVYFSNAGGENSAVNSGNQLPGPSINYSSSGVGGSFQPPSSNTYDDGHFYATADFSNSVGLPSINSHDTREAKYVNHNLPLCLEIQQTFRSQ